MNNPAFAMDAMPSRLEEIKRASDEAGEHYSKRYPYHHPFARAGRGTVIDGSHLSTRARNALWFAFSGKVTRKKVARATREQMLAIPNCGRGTVEEIRLWLHEGGLQFSWIGKNSPAAQDKIQAAVRLLTDNGYGVVPPEWAMRLCAAGPAADDGKDGKKR